MKLYTSEFYAGNNFERSYGQVKTFICALVALDRRDGEENSPGDLR